MTKTLLKSLALAAVGTMMMIGSALATTFSPSDNEIVSMTELWDNPTGSATLLDFSITPAGNEFTIKFTDWDASGFAQIGLGNEDFTFFDLSSYDDYKLTFENTNFIQESMYVSLFMQTYENGSWSNFYQSDWTEIGYNESASLTLAFNSAHYYLNGTYQGLSAIGDPAKTFAYGFQVGNTEVVGYDTQIGHGAAAPIPEPATMLLFGTGLLGLAGIGRRKKSA